MFFNFLIIMFFAFVLTALSGLVILPWLKRLKASQTEREDGPASHLQKTGTPTMGGVMFLLVFLVISVLLSFKYRQAIPVAISTIGFGLVGFADDYIKVVMKRSLGLTPIQKMIGQAAVAAALLYYIANFTSVSFEMMVPFSALFSADANPVFLNLGIFTVPFLFVVILGTVNGSNFTDGLDGLLSSVTIVICIFIALASVRLGLTINYSAAAMMGCLFGFLIYNWHPAKVFMGDTGSLALGGFVAACMILMKMPIFIIFVAFIYLIEVISVIIQVLYFKATHGKRFFRMAPIHHHFELGGWTEVKVVGAFAALTAFLCLISFFMI
ncbi:Phospho-N-acetylmuramoyl-pentapeptide-transferase [Lachnospiraceae bacterium]|nr:Phospho-N-acetylmuramoyl-pentapeptide-transferase [Lachnospiraceae bacterium]